MMKRADKTYVPAEGCSAMEIIQCLTAEDFDACKAACSSESEEQDPEVVKAGTLTISTKDYSSSVVSAPSAGIVIFNSIKFAASEPITVNTLTLSKIGLSNNNSVNKVWFEKDGVRISSKGSITTDGTATVNFIKGLSIKSNETVDLVAELAGAAGAEVAFRIDSVNSTAEKTNINATTTTYRTTTYTVANLEYDMTTAQASYKIGEQDEILIAKFSLENQETDKNAVVKSITLDSQNSNVEDFLKDLRLVKDGKNVAKSISFDGKKIIVALDDAIDAGKKANYSLYAGIAALDNGTESIALDLANVEDVVVYEATTNFRAKVAKAAGIISPVCGTIPVSCVTINGGKIVFTNDSTFATTVTAGKGYTDAQIAKGTLTVAEPISFDKLVLTESGKTKATSSVKSMVLEIGGTRYNAEITDDGTDSSYTFGDIYVNKTSTVKLYVSLKNTAAGTITISNIAASTINKGEYQNNGTSFANTVIAGTVKVAKVTVKDSTFTLKNNDSNKVTVVINDSDNVKLFDGNLTSPKQNINLSEIIVNGPAMTSPDFVEFTLNVGNKTITKTYNATAVSNISFPISGIELDSNNTAITIEAAPHIATANTYQFTVQAKGTDNNGNPAESATVSAAPLVVNGASSLSLSNANQGNKAIVEGSDITLAEFSAYAQNGSVELTTVYFEATKDAISADNTYVELDGEQLAESFIKTSGTPDKFTMTISETLSKGTHKIAIKSTVNTDGSVAITNVKANTATLGATITNYFVKVLPEITVASGASVDNEITMNISLPENATLPIKITDLTFAGGSIYVNNQEETSTLTNPVTLNPGDSMTVVMKVTAAGTAKLTGIKYSTVEATPANYTVDKTYTNFPWGTFQVTYKS